MKNRKRITGLVVLLLLAVPYGPRATDVGAESRSSVLERRLLLMEYLDGGAPTPSVRTEPETVRRVGVRSGRRRVPDEVRRLADEAAARYGADRDLILAVIQVESAFKQRAVSCKGAMGYMQLMPGTARLLGVRDPFDARQNIFGGTRYLVRMYRKFRDWEHTLAAYNAGPERVEKSVRQHARIPSYTRGYVDDVLERYRYFRLQSESTPPARGSNATPKR